MKPKLNIDGEDYILIGIYKGFLYYLTDGNLLKYIVTTKDGVITKDINIGIKILSLYNILFNAWLVKEGINNILNSTTRYEEEGLPEYIESLEKYFNRLDKFIHSTNFNEQKYNSVLKEYKEVCNTKPNKRKKLPNNLNEIKFTLYEPLNFLLEKEAFTSEELNQFVNLIHEKEQNFFKFNAEWKKTLEEHWIHY